MAWKESIGNRFFVWLALVLAGLLVAWVTGRLEPHLVPDSPSYLDYPFDSLDAACRSIRTPGYPIWLTSIITIWGIGLVPACQVVAHATAVFLFVLELKRWSMSPWQIVVVGIAMGVGCTPTDHINTISTDALAASLGVITAALTLRWSRLDGSLFAALIVATVAAITIMVRPAYLFLIPWLFVAGWMLRRLRGSDPGKAAISSLMLAMLVLVPILGWMTLRFAVVSDFAVLPFGHQNLAGVLVQLVSDEELLGIDGDASKLASEIVDEKLRLAESGHTFVDGDPRATMTIDARWDDMTYFVVIPAAGRIAGADPIVQHRKIAQLNKAIIRKWPERYCVWLLKASRRGAWAIAADMVMHPVFLIAILSAIGIVLFRSITRSTVAVFVNPGHSMAALSIVTLTYLLMKVGFVALTSPPIGRFSDAAAIFLPAWLAAMFLVRWCADPVR